MASQQQQQDAIRASRKTAAHFCAEEASSGQGTNNAQDSGEAIKNTVLLLLGMSDHIGSELIQSTVLNIGSRPILFRQSTEIRMKRSKK